MVVVCGRKPSARKPADAGLRADGLHAHTTTAPRQARLKTFLNSLSEGRRVDRRIARVPPLLLIYSPGKNQIQGIQRFPRGRGSTFIHRQDFSNVPRGRGSQKMSGIDARVEGA